MKQTFILRENWMIRRIAPTVLDEDLLRSYRRGAEEEAWLAAEMPAQVHEILLAKGLIEDPCITGKAAECLWVGEQDWLYRCAFHAPEARGRVFLHFKGLDTLVDVYLNGRHLAYHNDMYLPLRLDVTSILAAENDLLLHFYSPHRFLAEAQKRMPPAWEGKIRPVYLMRKCPNDFDDYLGAKPWLTPIGVYADVLLEVLDHTEIEEVDLACRLAPGYTTGQVAVGVMGSGPADRVDVVLLDPDGRKAAEATRILPETDLWRADLEVSVANPRLWWPRGYGSQPLYEVIVSVYADGRERDRVRRRIGFRDLKMGAPFDFSINGKRVKLWGANFTPLQGISHCWHGERARTLLDMVENCNLNALRIWGGGVPYDDELYDEADRRGLLLWQEFFHNWGMFPDSEEYRSLYRAEATYMVKRLKHHPSILLWCGGNECYMGAEVEHPGADFIGRVVLAQDYPEICRRLDPERYYHPNSPYGGAFANDPRAGDTHGYTHIWYVPGADYPVMLSENTRTSSPNVKSLKRFVGEANLWPQGFTGIITHPDECPLPDTWMARSSGDLWPRLSPIEKFYDSVDVEALVYKFGAAHALHLRGTVERCRRGRPGSDPSGERRSMGHFVWKLNDTWPNIFCSMIDYYLEPYIPYYALKRACAPVLLSFEIGDHIYLWLVNDSPDEIAGTVIFILFDPWQNTALRELRRDVRVPAGESAVVMSLDELGMFKRKNVLYACLKDAAGKVIARTNDFAQIERRLRFPDARLSLSLGGDLLRVTTDSFARCIELSGDEGGDEFGWLFEDNYFDLLPMEIKTVRILGKHRRGLIKAKPHYSSHTAMIAYGE